MTAKVYIWLVSLNCIFGAAYFLGTVTSALWLHDWTMIEFGWAASASGWGLLWAHLNKGGRG